MYFCGVFCVQMQLWFIIDWDIQKYLQVLKNKG